MKNKDIVAILDAELADKIKAEKHTLEKMGINHAISPVESPAKIRETRRTIARLKTELNKRKATKK
ncbi:MAG: 50S ribosomal protein L29 [Bacteroidetes bacterium]|nr:50S ribosomal protein L29 [Bacteroidota bacterium]